MGIFQDENGSCGSRFSWPSLLYRPVESAPKKQTFYAVALTDRNGSVGLGHSAFPEVAIELGTVMSAANKPTKDIRE